MGNLTSLATTIAGVVIGICTLHLKPSGKLAVLAAALPLVGGVLAIKYC